ncbi:hypothetical protein Dimus_003240, partial [Dionaea muscipula]
YNLVAAHLHGHRIDAAVAAPCSLPSSTIIRKGQAPPATIRGHRLWRRPSPAELPLSPLDSRHLPCPLVAATSLTKKPTLAACYCRHPRLPPWPSLTTTKPVEDHQAANNHQVAAIKSPPPSNLQICCAFDFRHSTMVDHGEVQHDEGEQASERVQVRWCAAMATYMVQRWLGASATCGCGAFHGAAAAA